MKEEKFVKLLVNRSSNQCRLSVPQCFWHSVSKTGWYKMTEENGVLIYTPTNKTGKVRKLVPKIIDQKEAVKEIEVDPFKEIKYDPNIQFDYSGLSAQPENAALDIHEDDVWRDDVPT